MRALSLGWVARVNSWHSELEMRRHERYDGAKKTIGNGRHKCSRVDMYWRCVDVMVMSVVEAHTPDVEEEEII